jgi:branched-chain amino acid transport system substrate-binding protein
MATRSAASPRTSRTPNTSKIAIVYLDNGFGREALKTAQAAAKENNLEVLGVAAFKEDGSDIAQAIKSVAKANAPAVLLLTLAGPAPKVVEEYLRQASIRPQFFALSIVASDSLYKSIGEKSRGVIVTQIVPFPWDSRRRARIRREKDLGGMKLNFSPTSHNGSRLVEITMIGREGRLVR